MGEHPIKFVRPGGQLYRIFKVTGLVKIDVPAVGHPRDMLLFQFVRTCPCRHGVQGGAVLEEIHSTGRSQLVVRA